MSTKNICGIVIGEAGSPEEANSRAENMKNCPNLVVLGTTANIIYSVYVVSSEKEYPETNSKEIGLEKATVHIVRNVLYPKFTPRLPKNKKKTDTATCGVNCKNCPLRAEYGCSGCPVTIHHQQNKKHKKL